MTTTLPKRFEPFVVPGGLKGQISELPLPDILQQLRQARASGILSLVSGGARKAVYLSEGRVVFASSNLPNDRLGEILIHEGKITVEEYETSIKAISKGKRQGKALVEMGALSPKDLWEGVQFQVKEIVYSVFQWDEGQFHFEESSLPEKERITVDLDIRDLILAGLRRVDATGRIQSRYPEGDLLLDRAPGEEVRLEPYEAHVLKLVDGERSVLEKYLGALRESRKDVFGGTKLLKDGTLDPAIVERNLNRAPEEQQRALLVDALNELLYAELLAVKRTLGADHEASIIRALKER